MVCLGRSVVVHESGYTRADPCLKLAMTVVSGGRLIGTLTFIFLCYSYSSLVSEKEERIEDVCMRIVN